MQGRRRGIERILPSILIVAGLIATVTYTAIWQQATDPRYQDARNQHLEQWFRGCSGVAFMTSLGSIMDALLLLWLLIDTEGDQHTAYGLATVTVWLYRFVLFLLLVSLAAAVCSGMLGAYYYVSAGGVALTAVALAVVGLIWLVALLSVAYVGAERAAGRLNSHDKGSDMQHHMQSSH